MGDTPSLYGVGNYSAGIYSRTHSDASAVMVVTLSTTARAQKVKNIEASLTPTFGVFANIDRWALISTEIYALFGIDPDPHRVREAESELTGLFGIDPDPHRVRTIATDVPFRIDFVGGFVRVDARAVSTVAVTTVGLSNVVAGADTDIVVNLPIFAHGNVVAGAVSPVRAEFGLRAFPHRAAGASTDMSMSVTMEGAVQQGSFWNETSEVAPDWNELDDGSSPWVPVQVNGSGWGHI